MRTMPYHTNATIDPVLGEMCHPNGMTMQQICSHLDITRHEFYAIMESAMAKLKNNPVMYRLFAEMDAHNNNEYCTIDRMDLK